MYGSLINNSLPRTSLARNGTVHYRHSFYSQNSKLHVQKIIASMPKTNGSHFFYRIVITFVKRYSESLGCCVQITKGMDVLWRTSTGEKRRDGQLWRRDLLDSRLRQDSWG